MEDSIKNNNNNNTSDYGIGSPPHRCSPMADRSRKKYSHPAVSLSGGHHLNPQFPHPHLQQHQYARHGSPGHPGQTSNSRSPVMRRLKKTSMPAPILSLSGGRAESDDEDVTKRLETAVRRISRGSPNRSPLLGNSPKNSQSGLSGLAKGYEQYREWLTNLHPTTEFGEASSDDLSSEWESCYATEIESINNNRVAGATYPLPFARPGTPSLGLSPPTNSSSKDPPPTSSNCNKAGGGQSGKQPVERVLSGIRRPDIDLQQATCEDHARDGDDEGEGGTSLKESAIKPNRNSTKRVSPSPRSEVAP